MIIEKMELSNFRNYKDLQINFDQRTNILYGKNAQGKTNLLEAVYLSATTRSHKLAKDREMIKIGEDEGHIRSHILKDNGEYRIDIHLRPGRAKGIAVNRVPQKKASDIFGIVQVIFFSPEDLDIVKRGPDMRRRFLDMELCQIDKIYLNDLTLYKKTLNQRNRLLHDIDRDRSLLSTLSVWDEKLIQYGKKIINRRRRFIDELSIIVSEKYGKLSGNTEILGISYNENVSEEEYSKRLEQKRAEDLRMRQTTVGPHRDDIGFTISGMDARKFASQGQQRSCALSLKLSEIDIMEKHTGNKPILLLDDVLSELDTDRQRELLSGLSDVQTIITCTGMDEIKQNGFKAGKVFIVENATIRGE